MNGLSKTRLYAIFSGMKQRCYNPDSQHYKWYGAKGITICEEWLGENGLQSFVEWALNNGYEEHLSIDRVNSNGSYSPQNCRWITLSENVSRAHQFNCVMYPRTLPQKSGIVYKIDVLAALKTAGYSTYRIRKEKILGEATLQKIRNGESISWENMSTICKLLNCQPGDIVEYKAEE